MRITHWISYSDFKNTSVKLLIEILYQLSYSILLCVVSKQSDKITYMADIGPLQRIQNAAARLVTGTRHHEHISPILRSLHWLPVYNRIIFKVLLLAYKTKHRLSPKYLTELISDYKPASTMSLRSSTQCLLNPGPHTKTICYGGQSFAVAAPYLWNRLPLSIRAAASLTEFKRKLKSHLFNI